MPFPNSPSPPYKGASGLSFGAKLAIFLAIAAVFAWPGYMAVTAVVAPSAPAPTAAVVSPTREPAAPPLATPPPTPTWQQWLDRELNGFTCTDPAHTLIYENPNTNPPYAADFYCLAPPLAATPRPATTPRSTATPTPTATPRPTATIRYRRYPTPTPAPTASQAKALMLTLINDARADAGLDAVELGQNPAAQIHADTSLANCFYRHWGMDGLKAYMRYSLAGGYQSNAENAVGWNYCIKASDGYRPLSGIYAEVREAMQGLMNSPGHRATILDPAHRKVNISLAWNRYNCLAVSICLPIAI